MPVNRAKLKQLTDEKFRQGRQNPGKGMTIEVMDRALREASEELGVNPYTYENHADFEYGHRERIYLDQLEVVARVLEVSVSDLLDDSTRTHEWESGRKAGVRMAVAKMYSTLHGLGDG